MASQRKRPASQISTKAPQSATSAGISHEPTKSRKSARVSKRQSAEASALKMASRRKRPAFQISTKAPQSATTAGISHEPTKSRKSARVSDLVGKRPAAAPTGGRPKASPASAAQPQASGVSPAAGTSAKAAVAGTRHGSKGAQRAADDGKNLHKLIRKRPAHNPQNKRRVRGRSTQRESLDAKYPWGRIDGPPPASLADGLSLADQMTRLRKEADNFQRPERGDRERLAQAKAMLHIMWDKARVGFGGTRHCRTMAGLLAAAARPFSDLAREWPRWPPTNLQRLAF